MLTKPAAMPILKNFTMAAPSHYGFIHLSTPKAVGEDTLCSWVLVKSEQIISRGKGHLSEAVLACAKVPCAVALGAQNLIISSLKLPTKNQSQRRTAIPYAIQSQLAEPAKDNHWSWQSKGQILQLVGIRHSQLSALNTTFAQLGFAPKWLLADALHLGGTDDVWQMLITPNGWLLQQQPHSTYAINSSTPLTWLQKAYIEAQNTTNQPASINVTGPATPELSQWLTANNLATPELGNESDNTQETWNSAAILASHFNPKTCINLRPVSLHKNWAPKINWSLWRLPYALTLLLTLLGISHFWLSNAVTKQNIEHAYQQGQALFRSTLPNERLVDPISQLQAQVLSAQAPKDAALFLPMLHAFESLWSSQQAVAAVTMTGITFAEQQLHISLTGSQDQLKRWSTSKLLASQFQYTAKPSKPIPDSEQWFMVVTLTPLETN